MLTSLQRCCSLSTAASCAHTFVTPSLLPSLHSSQRLQTQALTSSKLPSSTSVPNCCAFEEKEGIQRETKRERQATSPPAIGISKGGGYRCGGWHPPLSVSSLMVLHQGQSPQTQATVPTRPRTSSM